MALIDLRNELDAIDDKIAKLLDERMKIVEKVAEEKNKQPSFKVTDRKRENEVLLRVTDGVEERFYPYVKRIYGGIFSASKALQSKLSDKKPSSDIVNALTPTENEFPFRARVACQGVEGAYSEIAARKLIELPEISYFKSFDAVFSAVEKGFSKYGVLPVENSYAGSVNRVYDLMRDHKFYIVKSVKLTVSHCLCAIDGAKKSDIKKVVSHEQAIAQCRNYLEVLGNVSTETAENTALSAKFVSELKDKSVAAICSKESAELYGLTVLDSNIQDSVNNYTRFILISKTPELYKGSNKISIMTTLPHRPGSLAELLGRFASIGINLTKLESRPIAEHSFEFMFYFDFECDPENPALLTLLSELEDEGTLNFLGAYGEIIS